MKKIPIVFDCDTGTDDALAIIAALYCGRFDIRAFTTVAGNVPLLKSSVNTLNLVRYLGFDIPVARGAAKPLLRRHDDLIRLSIHGEQGMGPLVLPVSDDSFATENAIEMIKKLAVELGGELEIIATGPLTNIALFVSVYPELCPLIKRIVFMGGAVMGGNLTTSAEFNIFVDPEAARIVLRSGIPLIMVGLDVTQQCRVDAHMMDATADLKAKAGKIFSLLFSFMGGRTPDEQGRYGSPVLHDPLAVAVAALDDMVGLSRYFVDVECEGTYTYGHTFVAKNWRFRGEPNCYVAEAVDSERFKAWLLDTVAAAEVL